MKGLIDGCMIQRFRRDWQEKTNGFGLIKIDAWGKSLKRFNYSWKSDYERKAKLTNRRRIITFGIFLQNNRF
ncbi:MAG: hypothetical protein A3G57_01670 [Candidatus Andersenbacteria bacterium RIFCSPLOWO2_12_FULL_45_8]|nr:MAG: hypothetical protein A3B76_05925 [Candidatus Andersenbacteria bacterium RIFCSPHIGHO2_02_FULL_46_16]OGY38306.1 MAG: hypothetical protein A3I08_03395 [Candidatus Andersenbacteria bacterium RIFCSPLOWO2_02_FULL_46_11]OGY42978.1 MAG: hypothetical protein A3G57_01670 [Candidatus Andersenbacteria bacterium RIFCSPLOWO2_12_FULL_45_8]HBE89967.1 hypothetical protein [Candidatus Andersenbacteria bacterium]